MFQAFLQKSIDLCGTEIYDQKLVDHRIKKLENFLCGIEKSLARKRNVEN